MARPQISLAALALAGCVLASGVACSDSGDSTRAPSVEGSTLAPNPEAPSALRFSAPSVGGGTIDFTQYAGHTVVLWFWAPT